MYKACVQERGVICMFSRRHTEKPVITPAGPDPVKILQSIVNSLLREQKDVRLELAIVRRREADTVARLYKLEQQFMKEEGHSTRSRKTCDALRRELDSLDVKVDTLNVGVLKHVGALTTKVGKLETDVGALSANVTELMYPSAREDGGDNDGGSGSGSSSDNERSVAKTPRAPGGGGVNELSRRPHSPYDGQDGWGDDYYTPGDVAELSPRAGRERSRSPYDGQDGWGDDYYAHNDD